MKLIDREPIGRTRFLKLEKQLAAIYPPRRKKAVVDIGALAKDLRMDYGVTYANWRQAGMMAVSFERKVRLMLEDCKAYIPGK